MRKLTVRLTPDNQIEVTVGTESRRGETHYLGLSGNQAPDADPALAARTGVEILLREWLRLLAEMPDHQQLFLPFDFSDELTRWLTIQREGSEASLVFGWSTVEGWAISPDNFEEYSRCLPEFVPDEPLNVQTFYLPRLICNVRQSLRELVECRSILRDSV